VLTSFCRLFYWESFLQVLRISSREASNALTFGSGITTSLRSPFEITLKPNDWTDISTPYQFPILLRDILLETGTERDSLQMCIWEKTDSTTYEGKFIFIGGTSIITQVRDTIKAQPKYDAYTVYNKSSNPITLVIPPVPVAVSPSHSDVRTTKERNDDWKISFKWCVQNDNKNPYYRNLPCFYKNEGGKENIFGPMPPTMSTIQVGVSDTSDNSVHGWACQYKNKLGGVVYKIEFENNSKKNVTLEYHLDNLENLSENYKAKILDRNTMSYETDGSGVSTAIELHKKEKQNRYVVVGTDGFFDNILSRFSKGC
jgi:hypothetical protein